MTFYNQIVDKRRLKKLIALAFRNYGSAHSSQVADDLKNLGFRYATKAGVSISIDDLTVPPAKRGMLQSAEQEISRTEARYARGEITEVERFQKVIDTWNSTSEELKDEVVRNFRKTDPLNSVYMMAFSGARGNMSQVRQLVGMRGLMADPQGQIIDQPIKTNFREGLTVTEYVISSYGARKGLVDTALRTADSGYLTRRLVDVSQDVIVREIDCGTRRGLMVKAMKDGERVKIALGDRLLGRVLAEDVIVGNDILAKRNQAIDAELAAKIGASVEYVIVRSPLTCEAARSVCQSCYGWSLATGRFVDLGEAVGIIAAQSIGEPGTQLTMRTFHTGGVFTGEVAEQIKSPSEGIIRWNKGLSARKVRTRHGEDAFQVEVGGELNWCSSKNDDKSSYSITPGSVLFVADGDSVQKDKMLAEVTSAKTTCATERATKDVSTDLAGEVFFASLVSEEKTDRQGNTTHIAQRGGLVWILSGEVYNFPPGAEPTVSNGDQVVEEDVLAETKLVSMNGGIVRYLSESREIDIITASVSLDKAEIRRESSGGHEQYIIYTAENQRFLLKATPETKVQNHAVIAELIDNRCETSTGGILRYGGIEVAKGSRKTGYEILGGGTLLWVPEETHEVNKDISLLIVEDGQYVEAGTEVVKDIFCQSSGVVEVVQKNDILREIIIKPGEFHLDVDPNEVVLKNEDLVPPGTEVLPGVVSTDLCQVEWIESTEGQGLLLRPVEEYNINHKPKVPSQNSINGKDLERHIELRTVQKLFYKDGERVKSVDGVHLLNTQLVLEIETGNDQLSSTLVADIELKDDDKKDCQRLQLVILESLTLRRDLDTDPYGGIIKTSVLVSNGDQISPGDIVAKTQIRCKENGRIRGIKDGLEAVRRLLVVRNEDIQVFTLNEEPKIKENDLVVAGTELASGVITAESGLISSINKISASNYKVTLRLARPYRVSAGAILHVDDGDLVQRGDNLVLLVYERAKTGDIIQGLPRIEELLEARKPKEACILARKPGVCQIEYSDNEILSMKVVEEDGAETDYPILLNQNVIVSDNQKVDIGEHLTDGPANPHELLEVFFNHYVDKKGVYEAALIGLQEAQKFLVDQVQVVYQSQGIDISDKHIEVIVRQMTAKVRVDDGGDTTMLPGELVELRQIEQVNEAMSITGGAPAMYTPVLLGITKASLNTDSFISAASFQETTRVLTEAAIEGKSDWLRGLKENVIIGRLIPAGTGFNVHEEMLTGAVDASDDNSDNQHEKESKQNNKYDREHSNRLLGSTLDKVDENMILDDNIARAYTKAETPWNIYGKEKDDE